jgi:hypothetical protein
VTRLGENKSVFCFVQVPEPHLKYFGVCGRIELNWILKKQDGDAWTVHLPLGMDCWWAVVNTVMSPKVS